MKVAIMDEWGSTERSIDKIFRELQNCLIDDGTQDEKKTVLNRKVGRIKRQSRPMEKMLKKTFAKHWVEIQNVQERHSKNERGMNQLMKKHMKEITKKWQADLMKTKLAADEVQKETRKLKSLLKKKPILKGQASKKVSDLHRHFKTSDGYLTKLHRRNLRQTYHRYKEEEQQPRQ